MGVCSPVRSVVDRFLYMGKVVGPILAQDNMFLKNAYVLPVLKIVLVIHLLYSTL